MSWGVLISVLIVVLVGFALVLALICPDPLLRAAQMSGAKSLLIVVLIPDPDLSLSTVADFATVQSN